MSVELIRNLILNASLLLIVSILYSTFYLRHPTGKWWRNSLLGVAIGVIGILLIVFTVRISSGVILDMRSVLVSACGLFFGFVPTVIAVAMITVYRVMVGGGGVLSGVTTAVLTAAFGLLWRYFRMRRMKQKKSIWLEFYLFGLLTHILMLIDMGLAMPSNLAFGVLREIWAPVLLLYPFGTLLLCMTLHTKENNIRTGMELERSEQYFRTLFDQAPIGLTISTDYAITYVNKAFERILGRSSKEYIAIGWEKCTHPDDLEKDLAQMEVLKAGKIDNYRMVKRYIRPDGTIVWADMLITSLHFPNNPEKSHICMIQDVTDMFNAIESRQQSQAEYKNLYYEFRKRQRLLVSLLDSIPDLIFYKDMDGRYIGCNNAFERRVGRKESDIVGHSDFDLFPRDKAEFYRAMDQATLRQSQPRRNEDIVTYPDGGTIVLETLKTPYYDDDGNLLGLIGISRDITDRKRTEEEIRYLNYHDRLTGLYNRSFFEEEKARLDTGRELPLSVIVGDIDGLKLINDSFGHAEGDKLLIEIAKILKGNCRAADILARTGGDEFCILLPRTDGEAAMRIVERIRKACAEYVTRPDKEAIYASISLGYATKTAPTEYLDRVIKVAEDYMYRRKLLESKSLHSSILSSIKSTMFEKNNETEEHAERMAKLSASLGRILGLGEEDLINLELASTLHDIGKIGIDSNILGKQSPLTDDEWVEMRKHPEVGYRIAQSVPELRRISEYILSHHERWDGKGYPRGLAGEDIPLPSRVLAVIDAFDAMTQNRSYRKAMPEEAAIAEIQKNAGTQFDPAIVGAFIHDVLEKETHDL